MRSEDLFDSLQEICTLMAGKDIQAVVTASRQMLRTWNSGVHKGACERKADAYLAFKAAAELRGLIEFDRDEYDEVLQARAAAATAAKQAAQAGAEGEAEALEGGPSGALEAGAEAEEEVLAGEEEDPEGSAGRLVPPPGSKQGDGRKRMAMATESRIETRARTSRGTHSKRKAAWHETVQNRHGQPASRNAAQRAARATLASAAL